MVVVRQFNRLFRVSLEDRIDLVARTVFICSIYLDFTADLMTLDRPVLYLFAVLVLRDIVDGAREPGRSRFPHDLALQGLG